MGIWRSLFETVRNGARTFARTFPQFLLHGPQHDRHDERPRLSETLFPWPVRLGIVVSSWLLARIWVHTDAAGQIGWTLEYAGVVAISLAASLWRLLFVVDAALAGAWLAFTVMRPRAPEQSPYRYWTHQCVELANRQFAHIEAFWIWMGVVLPSSPRIDVQIPALVGLAILGPALIDWIAELLHPGVSRGSGELQSARRPVIYGFMVLGLVLLVGRSAGLQANLVPLAATITFGLGLRVCRHILRHRQAERHRDHVQAFRRKQRQLTRSLDVILGPVFMLASVAGLLLLSLWLRVHHDRVIAESLDGPPPDREACVAEPGGPVEADVSLFLVADSQLHELGGDRFPGQTELADLLVPSAVRPVELDMLGAASVARLRHMFTDVVGGAGTHPVFWAHLGDFADLSCTGEIQRAIGMFSRFGPRLAGVAPGNHDMSFTGNFFWSPYWTGACKSTPADKAASNGMIASLLDRQCGVAAEGVHVSLPAGSWWPGWLAGTGGLVTVTPLGSVLHHHATRSVVAIFVDTSDDATSDWGIAGVFGTYSKDQDERLRTLVLALDGSAMTDPLWLVFSHHPLGEMTGASRERLENTLAWLDGDPFSAHGRPVASLEPRVLAMIAAHTHRSETHRVCVGHRVLREIVVGSTIDAPQQGAVLEIGTDRRGLASARLTTVPTVARPGFTCGAKPAMIDAETCRRIVARLKRDPDCEPLFDEGPSPARDCGELEQASDFGDTVRELITSTNPVDPQAIKRAQTLRARRLMTCVCRKDLGPGVCAPIDPDGDPLEDDVFARRIDERLASGGEQAETELACLSWAASAQQVHKAMGMSFASALRCAFDDRTIPAAQESVATLDVQPCQ